MPTKITKRTVDAIPPAPKDVVVLDTEVKGFGLKVTPAGKKVYFLQYRMGGRGTPTRRYTIGPHGSAWTPDKAREEAIRLRGLVAAKIDPAVEKKAKSAPVPKAATFAVVANDYLDRYARPNLRPSSFKETKRILERDVKPVWGSKSIHEVTRRDALALLDGIADRGAAVQANRTLARLRTLFNWAIERDYIAASPLNGLKLSKEIARDRALSDDEVRWFWRGCNQLGWPFGPLFQLLLVTAQRRDEVGTMEWTEVDLDKRLWTIPREKAKNDKAHEVHLSDQAAAIVAGLPRICTDGRTKGENPADGRTEKESPFVFTTNGERPVSGFSKAKSRLDRLMIEERRKALKLPVDDAEYRKALGLEPEAELPVEVPPWILHDLRRTAATGMARLNVPPHVVDKILNHVSGSIRGVAAVYNRHSYTEERRNALEAWGRHIRALLDAPDDAPSRASGDRMAAA